MRYLAVLGVFLSGCYREEKEEYSTTASIPTGSTGRTEPRNVRRPKKDEGTIEQNSGSGTKNSAGSSADLIEHTHQVYSAEYDKFFTPRGSQCPPTRFLVDGVEVEFESVSDMSGSDSKVYMSKDQRLVAKTLAPMQRSASTQQTFDALSMERAVHEVIGNLDGYSVNMHKVEGMPEGCLVATTVSDFGGQFSLDRLKSRMLKRQKELARIAAKAIRILRAVHDKGIVHGDVHKKNFVTSDLQSPAATLRIIDFGRAAPYLDKAGNHIRFVRTRSWGWNKALLSPWELEDSPLSRRDDMYRLSEMLLRLVGMGPLMVEKLEEKERAEIVAEKRKVVADAPKKLRDFHQAMLRLDFRERPDYEGWIREFKAAAKAATLDERKKNTTS